MFYYFFAPLSDYSLFFNVFRYVTFRALAAFVTALLFTIYLSPKIIRILVNWEAVETVNEYAPETHRNKQGTPTMGGLIIILGFLLSVVLWNNPINNHVLIIILVTLWLGSVGFWDDYLKNILGSKKGLVERYKLLGQVSIAIIVVLLVYISSPDKARVTSINVPFFKSLIIPLKWFYFPFVIFMIVGTSNAVNITDGLDGLAGGTIIFSTLALGIMAYIKGNINHAQYLQLDFIQEAGELSIITASIIGSVLGFLWYNTNPAEIFMGDTGSLALGGILATLAILLKEEIFFAITGGVFVIEMLSTMIQRYYFKYTRRKSGTGKRVFLCAPLHHHFEKKGIAESKIVVRFWIVAALFAALGLATIKLR